MVKLVYHAYAEIARFVRNHAYLLPLLGFHRPDVPCDDTFRYAVKHLDMANFEAAVAHWAQQELAVLKALLAEKGEGASFDAYAADGKSVRGSRDELKGEKAVQLLSLMHQHYHTVIAQKQLAAKRGEISAAKALFEGMSLVGMVITADALLTQKGITSVIEQQGGRYVLILKGNHRQAQELLAEVFREDLPPQAGRSEHHTSEVRKGWPWRRLELVPTNFGVEGFVGVKQVGKLMRYRYHKRKRQEIHETVYLITNLSPQEADAKQVLTWLRGHWAIENNLHRTRDVQMHEDAYRVRQGHAPRFLATLSNAIIGLLKRRGYDSVKRAAESFRANPTLALDLITRAG